MFLFFCAMMCSWCVTDQSAPAPPFLLPMTPPQLLHEPLLYVHLSSAICVCWWVLVIWCACVCECVLRQQQHELTTFSRKWKILQHLPETHSTPACAQAGIHFPPYSTTVSTVPSPPIFFLPLPPSFLSFFPLSQRLELCIQYWQFISTLFVITVPVTPNNQITETDHYASLSSVQMIPACTPPVPKSDFPFPAASPIVPISLLSLAHTFDFTFPHLLIRSPFLVCFSGLMNSYFYVCSYFTFTCIFFLFCLMLLLFLSLNLMACFLYCLSKFSIVHITLIQ